MPAVDIFVIPISAVNTRQIQMVFIHRFSAYLQTGLMTIGSEMQFVCRHVAPRSAGSHIYAHACHKSDANLPAAYDG